MVNPRSLQNLVRFENGPDARRNTSGRGKSLTTLIKEALRKDSLCGSPIPGGMEAAEFLAEAMVGHAIKGHATCISEVLGRIEGRMGVGAVIDGETGNAPTFNIIDNGRDNVQPSTGSADRLPGDTG